MSTPRNQLKHQTYLAMAQQLSGLSTCLRVGNVADKAFFPYV